MICIEMFVPKSRNLMLLNHCRRILPQVLPSLKQLQQSLWAIGFALLLSSTGGCASINQLNSTLSSTLSPSPVELNILQVEPEASGIYTVSGNTTLPSKTQITVSAVRYFKDPQTAETSSNYAILDRQIAEVNQGTWQTRLNIWQASANGQFQEAWQANPSFGKPVEPEATVTFLAALEPTNQSMTVQKQVESLDPSKQAAITRFTTDGELYLQVSKSIAILPPVGKPSVVATEPVQNKPRLAKPGSDAPDGQLIQQPQTDLPISPEAFLH